MAQRPVLNAAYAQGCINLLKLRHKRSAPCAPGTTNLVSPYLRAPELPLEDIHDRIASAAGAAAGAEGGPACHVLAASYPPGAMWHLNARSRPILQHHCSTERLDEAQRSRTSIAIAVDVCCLRGFQGNLKLVEVGRPEDGFRCM